MDDEAVAIETEIPSEESEPVEDSARKEQHDA
ncbi:MAG: hypothetical protein JWM36_423 [Hyphomicrobiales bacterium]|nr:hypothetical protein [Hyphomicrobiales bacterium]